MSTAAARPTERLDHWPQLDVARAVVVAGLIFFHAALVFDTADDFYVKNDRTTDLTPFAAPVVIWAMPLLFLIAGLGTWHSWHGRGPSGYLTRRVRRLLVPLVAGTVLLNPVSVWFRLRADPGYTESFATFYPRFFRVRWDWARFPFVLQPAADGRGFETGHLWFLVLLLLYSLLAMPLLWWLGSRSGRRATARLAVAAGRSWATLLPALLLAAVAAPGLDQAIAAWNVTAYGLFFAAGALLAVDGRFRDAVHRDARPAAVVAVVALALSAVLLLTGEPGADPLMDRSGSSVAGRVAFGVAGWCATVAIVGALARRPRDNGRRDRHRSDTSRMRAAGYVRGAVLPWYVLHQPVVVAVAFYVVRLPLGPLAKYAVICAASVAITLVVYDLLVRRTALTRALLAGE
jgi:glucans biosynthesis protein C